MAQRDEPPPGFEFVKMEYWESVTDRRDRAPVNGHRGVYAYHNDDCRCGMYDNHCNRDGHVWSCCGSTQRYSRCREA